MHGCEAKEKDQLLMEQDKEIERVLSGITHKIIVMSGKGGVGKSTISVNLAVALALKGYAVGLLDIDLHGPSVPTMLGLQKDALTVESGRLKPLQYRENLKVLSMGSLLPQKDAAVIWRGPMKIGAIRQFLTEADWGKLDYLVVDSPPGTGDEPLTIVQTLKGAQAVIVTTPQEMALADVRKCMNFCTQLNIPMIGLIENMSGLCCPHCGKNISLMGQGGGAKAALAQGIPFLGSIPFDPEIVTGSDEGRPTLAGREESGSSGVFLHIVEEITKNSASRNSPKLAASLLDSSDSDTILIKEEKSMKIAVPVSHGEICAHFGHCEEFALFSIKEGKVNGKEAHTPPPHEPGVLPRWLSGLGVTQVIAGGMGSRARELFKEAGVDVIVGAGGGSAEDIVRQYLSGTLATGVNVCDH